MGCGKSTNTRESIIGIEASNPGVRPKTIYNKEEPDDVALDEVPARRLFSIANGNFDIEAKMPI